MDDLEKGLRFPRPVRLFANNQAFDMDFDISINKTSIVDLQFDQRGGNNRQAKFLQKIAFPYHEFCLKNLSL